MYVSTKYMFTSHAYVHFQMKRRGSGCVIKGLVQPSRLGFQSSWRTDLEGLITLAREILIED